MDISRQAWTQPTSDAAAWARAGGRRHYNSLRQLHAELRRAQVARLLLDGGLHRGTQAQIARQLGVSEATISRQEFSAPSSYSFCAAQVMPQPKASSMKKYW